MSSIMSLGKSQMLGKSQTLGKLQMSLTLIILKL